MLTKPTLLGHFASVLLLCSSSMVAMAETEPDNNTSNTADVINIGEPQTATISSVRDTDWFKFTVTQPGDYQIEVSGVGRDVDIALDLYASDATILIDSKNNGFDGDPETISFANASLGNYLVKVTQTGFFGSNTGYTLTLTDITKPKEAGSITLITDTNSLTNVVAGTTPSTVEFQLLNSEGNTAGMGDKPVSFTLTGPAGWTPPSLSNTTTSTDGKFTFDWKDANGAVIPFTKAGEYTLVVAAEGQNKSVTVTIIPADPAKLTWVGTGTQPTEVPTYIAQSLAFEVRDQYENLVKAGQTIEVQITKPDATSMAPDSSSSLTTDANGQVEVVFTPDQAGNYTIKALSSSTEVMTVMSSLPTLVGQVGEDNTSVTFTLTDKNGKGIDRQPLDVSLPQQPTGGTASLEPSGALTTKDGGKVAVSLTGATVAGDYVVSAKLSSSKTTNSDVYAVNNEVTVSVAATALDLTVKGGETQTISSDTASAQITFELKAGVNPISGTLEVTLSKESSQHKACLVNAETAVCDANNLVTTLSVTTDATSGEGSVWLKDAKLAGEYTITATLQGSNPPLSKEVKVSMPNFTVGTVGKDKLSRQVQYFTLAEVSKAVGIVFNLTDKAGKALAGKVNFDEIKLAPAEASTPVGGTVVCLGIDANKPCTEDDVRMATVDAKTGQVEVFLKGLEIGKYSVVATLGNTEVKAEMVVEVGNLAVTEGGNQTVLVSTEGGKSKVITLTLNDGAGGDEIFKTSAGQAVKDKMVILTVTDSLGNPVTGLGLVEEGKNDGIPPQNFLTLATNAKGEVKIIFQAPPATVVSEAEPVAAYKITAQVNGLEEYTEVFVVTKAVKELVCLVS